MYINKYYAWMKECVKIIEKENERQINVNTGVMLSMSAIIKAKTKKSYTRKRVWINEILQQRQFHGFYEYIFPVLQIRKPHFKNYFRMSATEFEELLCIVGPSIYKQFHIREAVSPGERLCITLRYKYTIFILYFCNWSHLIIINMVNVFKSYRTLKYLYSNYRYLASGDMMSSMQYHYLRGLTTVSNIIRETCTAIWDCLHSLVLPASLTTENWLSIAKDFEDLWNFPHCIGAIDGKHIVIQVCII